MDVEVAAGAHVGSRRSAVKEIQVASRFSRHLGGRYKSDGPWSGEAFRDAVLLDCVQSALDKREPLLINFDGVAGTPTSFLEEAFGGMLRAKPEWKLSDVKRFVKIDAPKTPFLKTFMELAYQYMDRADARRMH